MSVVLFSLRVLSRMSLPIENFILEPATKMYLRSRKCISVVKHAFSQRQMQLGGSLTTDPFLLRALLLHPDAPLRHPLAKREEAEDAERHGDQPGGVDPPFRQPEGAGGDEDDDDVPEHDLGCK